MSVLIRGMEMPTNCFLCPLSVLNENRLFCEVTKNEVVRAKIDADCPLVPVPPHGRLIDGDEADEYAYDELEISNSYLSPREASRNMQLIYKNMPTIIPAEEAERR